MKLSVDTNFIKMFKNCELWNNMIYYLYTLSAIVKAVSRSITASLSSMLNLYAFKFKFIQSNLQMRTMEAIKINKRAMIGYASAITSLS